ncbi:MAG TPA: hypothetical protein ENJ95_18455 [Bacteroidetes bacterium]|nr:hypothetical protein [Bacteroidota bacterium]
MPKSIHFDKIEAYLTGQLPPEEARRFEQEAAKDEQLGTELKLQQLEHEAMERMLEKELKNKMASWADNPPAKPFLEKKEAKVVQMNVWKRWPLLRAAAVIGGILLTVALLRYFSSENPTDRFVNEPPKNERPDIPPANDVQKEEKKEKTQIVGTPEKPTDKAPAPEKKKIEKPAPVPKPNSYLALATTAYQAPPPFSSGLKSGSMAEEKSPLLQAAGAFDSGRYAEALQLLGLPANSEQSTKRYLRGHVYFQLKNYRAAADEFAAVASDEFLPNYQEAQWYLLLSYLAQVPEKKKKFETLAKQLAGDEYSDYREEAEELLEKVGQWNGLNG